MTHTFEGTAVLSYGALSLVSALFSADNLASNSNLNGECL